MRGSHSPEDMDDDDDPSACVSMCADPDGDVEAWRVLSLPIACFVVILWVLQSFVHLYIYF